MPFTAAVITVSDTCSAGTAVDLSGPLLRQLLADSVQPTTIKSELIPDDAAQIETVLRYHSDVLRTNLIITTGGTGFGPRDVTPEATRRCIDREAPQLTLRMAMYSLEKTKFAALSRAVCGIRGSATLIVNMPGSKKAVAECFEAIVDVLPHALQHMNNELGPIRAVHAAVQQQDQQQQPSQSTAAVAAARKPHVCPHKTGTGSADDRNSPYPMEPVRRAVDLIRQSLRKSTQSSAIAEQRISCMDLPPFRASMKDGYVMLAGQRSSSELRVLGAIAAGDPIIDTRLLSDECYKINTGAAIPIHANCVIQVEDTTLLETSVDGAETLIRVNVDLVNDLDIRPIGCDLRKSEILYGDRNPGAVQRNSMLASVGQLSAWRQPRIGIISTGDELIAPGQALTDGKIYDSNSTMLTELCRQFGFEHVQTAFASDDLASLRSTMKRLSDECEITICTGGVSMGDKDFVKAAMQELDFTIRFGRVNMKPGKPMTFAANAEGRAIFGLPGNPVSAFVCFHLFVLPALRFVNDCAEGKLELPVISVELVNDAFELDARPEYARATITSRDGRFLAEITGDQISSRLRSIVGADVLLHLPASQPGRTHLPKGTILKASILSHHFISKYE